MPKYSTPFVERFWAKVDRSGGPDACWPWLGSRNAAGYGTCGDDGPDASRLAHRNAWVLTHGPIPEGISVLHHCDFPPCCNAEAHHFLGTYLDNARDRQAKGRGADNHREMPGEAHPLARLTDDNVRAIRLARAQGVPGDVLAERYGVTRPLIYNIEARRRWKHVVDDAPLPVGTAGRRDKLTEDDVRAIRAEYASGTTTQEVIAKRFGISRPAVSLIVHRHTWKHVP